MSNAFLSILPDAAAVADAAERLLYDRLKSTLSAEGRFFVALSGGTTPRALYKLVTERRGPEANLYGRTDWFMGDERAVPWDNPQSNCGEAARMMLDPMAVAQGRRHFPNGGVADLDREADRLTGLLRWVMGTAPGEVPRFHLILLGVGTDGHTASLFPGTSALDASLPGYVANDVPQLAARRLTLTYPVLGAAREIVVLCTGENKASVVADVFARPDRSDRHPVERVTAERVLWLLDEPAASGLDAATRERHTAPN